MPLIPPQLFLTPFTNPWERPALGSSAIAEAGQMQMETRLQREKLAAQRQQAAAEMSMNQARLGIQQQETIGRNKYYDDQIAARREETGARQSAAKDRQVAALHSALRRAAEENNQTSVEMIRRQLGALGYATEEVPSALDDGPADEPLSESPRPAPYGKEAPPEPESAATPGMAPRPAPYGLPPDILAVTGSKGPKSGRAPTMWDRIKAGAEKQAPPEPESEKASEAPSGASAAPGEESLMAMPWDVPGTQKKKRGGKFVVRDPEGNPVVEIDAPLDRSKRDKSIADTFEPYIRGARSKEEKDAAELAQKVAVAAASVEGTTAERAVEIGRDTMSRQLQGRPHGAATPAGRAGGGTGPKTTGPLSSKDESRLFRLNNETRQTIAKVDAANQLPAARKDAGSMAQMEEALKKAGTEGFAGGSAISQYLKALSGAQVSDKERADIYGGAGMQAYYETEVNKYVNGGKLSPDLIRGLQGVASRARKVFNARLESAYQSTADMLDSIPSVATPAEREQQKKAARAYILGREAAAPTSAPADRAALEKKLREKYGGGQ